MALQTEIWVQDIAPNLFPNDSFSAHAIDDSAFVENKTVHLPQAGLVPVVERNRTVLPAVIAQRPDADFTYNLVEFTSSPTLIVDIDAIEVSYDKRQSVLREHTEQLRFKMHQYLLSLWCPSVANQIIPTTGAVRPGAAPGATGTRKALTKADVLKLKTLFDSQDIPMQGRKLLLDAFMYSDILGDPTLTNTQFTQATTTPGAVGNLFGFDVFIRSSLGRMATGNTAPKDPDAANAATDNSYGLAWHPSFVRRALGEVKVYSDDDKPEYYGSILSTMARAGGSKYYSNQRGVAALAEVV
jgi:hypothetical protein